ncbi:hypothetical protein [Chlorogloea sp. CCALA 695]|uniref:hypothetical protein n=1 Tax=Chlorogloea sp. CCALA 695 TaxID=2107693 RepID=UPI000D07E86F|nr:hypothetical protein [Chlorogloea sp. CCALA 695]PSB29607.1 hypothetical protein C7B70_18130 [Chlorogloea sp. CCALA 695]
MNLDYSVYPDIEDLPQTLHSPEDKADYVARICHAWDFGIVPTLETFELFGDWQEIFNEFVVPHSPAYAAFRDYYGWKPIKDTILEAPWEKFDRVNGRTLPDPCENML